MSSSAARHRRGLAYAAALALVAGTGAPARATDTVDTTVTTLLTGRADPIDGQLHTVLPVYESLSVLATIRRPFTDGIRVVFSGWGGMIVDIPQSQSWSGDIDLGYVEGGFFQGRLQARLGRQFIVGGAARMVQIDGLSAAVRLLGGLHLSAYGGEPVTPRFAVQRGDAIVGGRLFYRRSFHSEVGLSFNQINNRGLIARQDLGADARYVPLPQLTLTGYALFSLAEARLAEGHAAVLWQPRSFVQLSADYRRTAPDLFLPRNSVLSMFSQETRDEAGATLYLRAPGPLSRLRLYGDYRAIINAPGVGGSSGGVGHDGGGKLSAALGQRDGTTLSVEVRALKLPQRGYTQLRLYSLHHLSPSVLGTLSLNTFFLDQPINGGRLSMLGAGTVAWELGHGFRLVTTGSADVSPFVQRRFEFIVRLAYNATRHFREVHP